jgi:hypothetical protein
MMSIRSIVCELLFKQVRHKLKKALRHFRNMVMPGQAPLPQRHQAAV